MLGLVSPLLIRLRPCEMVVNDEFFCVSLAAAVLFGVLGGTICNFATQLKFVLGYDDALDVSLFFVDAVSS